jgi:hypothetical protein
LLTFVSHKNNYKKGENIMDRVVTFTKYVREECADGVVAFFVGNVDGEEFSGDYNQVDGLSIVPETLHDVVTKAASRGLSCYPSGIIEPVIVEI